MDNFIALVIIALIIGAAVAYLIKQKKNGSKCLGCSSCDNKTQEKSNCGCKH